MRYVVETMLGADCVNLQKIYSFRGVEVIENDTFSFDYDENDSFLLDDLVNNKVVVRVFTEDSYLKLNKNAVASKMPTNFKLLWYGRCDDYQNEYGTSIYLEHLANRDDTSKDSKFQEVWKRSPDTKNYVSWSEKIHPSIKQPFSQIVEGNMYLFNLTNDTDLQIKGLRDTNATEVVGVGNCGYNSTKPNSILANEYNLVWYGVCGEDVPEVLDLSQHGNITEVYQFTEKGSRINGVYYSDDISKSTITKLKFGNGYFIRLKKNTTENIKGCAVSDHVVLHTFAPTQPLRLQSCESVIESTPTPFSSVCCKDGTITASIVNGNAETVNYITITGSPDGTMCWDKIIEPERIQQYSVSLGNDFLYGGFSIISTGNVLGKMFRFTSNSGVCYQGKLSSKSEVNVFQIISDEIPTPSPTPVMEVTPTPTPVKEDPTPTPTPKPQTICCESETGITITKEMSDSTAPNGPSGVSISGFEEGAVLCIGTLTQESLKISCMMKLSDKEVVGLITLSFKPVDGVVKYKSADGICYTGVLQNTTTEPQLLTRE